MPRAVPQGARAVRRSAAIMFPTALTMATALSAIASPLDLLHHDVGGRTRNTHDRRWKPKTRVVTAANGAQVTERCSGAADRCGRRGDEEEGEHRAQYCSCRGGAPMAFKKSYE